MFDELEIVLGRYLKIVQNDLAYAKKDEQYFNKETLIKVCRLRDSLTLAYKTAAELNVLAGK